MCLHVLYLSLAVLCMSAICSVKAAAIENNIIFERIECDEPNHDFISQFKCEMRPVAPNVYRTNFTVHLRKPTANIWVYTSLHYRYSTYQRIAHQWEDLCYYLRHGTHAPVLKVMHENLKAMGTLIYTSQCPMTEFIFTQERFNASLFVIPLVPSGRYRIDLNVTQGKNGRYIHFRKFYFHISDFRVWH